MTSFYESKQVCDLRKDAKLDATKEAKMKQIWDDSHSQIAALLKDHQKKAFEEWQAQKQDEMRNYRH